MTNCGKDKFLNVFVHIKYGIGEKNNRQEIVMKKPPYGGIFNLQQLSPIFCDHMRDDGSEHRDRPQLPFWHGNHVYEHDVFLMVDMYVLLP